MEAVTKSYSRFDQSKDGTVIISIRQELCLEENLKLPLDLTRWMTTCESHSSHRQKLCLKAVAEAAF